MPFVKAKCTNCGETLEVDSSREAAVCPSCGSAYIVENAVNNYNNHYNYNISNNITDSVVNIYGGATNDFDIRGGVLVKYNGAATNVVIPIRLKKLVISVLPVR